MTYSFQRPGGITWIVFSLAGFALSFKSSTSLLCSSPNYPSQTLAKAEYEIDILPIGVLLFFHIQICLVVKVIIVFYNYQFILLISTYSSHLYFLLGHNIQETKSQKEIMPLK